MNKLIINYGSINIDHVYQVAHFVRPGETLSSSELCTGLGGKGANQSVAIARAGGTVLHVGQIGHKDDWALEVLREAGVNIDNIVKVDQASGHAIIQVDAQGENAILLHGGANQSCDVANLKSSLSANTDARFLLLQNECNGLEEAIDLAHQFNLKVVLNPAPMTDTVRSLPLNKLSILIVNQLEAEALSGVAQLDQMFDFFQRQLPTTTVVITLGSGGSVLLKESKIVKIDAHPVTTVMDTTGAGDTFVGYFLSAVANGNTELEALEIATKAAALTVTKLGAIDAIPIYQEVEELLNA